MWHHSTVPILLNAEKRTEQKGVCCTLHITKIGRLFFFIFWMSKTFVCHQTASRDKIFMYITAQISASVVAFRARRAGTVVLNDFLLDLLIQVYHLLPQLSFPPPLSVVEWDSFNVKLLLLIKEEGCQISKGYKFAQIWDRLRQNYCLKSWNMAESIRMS